MNIALFASAFHPSLGGVEELCRQLAHANNNQGHEVSVWTERWPRTLPAFEWYENIAVYRFPMRVPARSWKSKLSYFFSHPSIRSQIINAIQRRRVEVLHVQCVSSSAWYALEVKKALKIPLVVTLQGELNMDAAGAFQRPGIGQRIMRRALREADAITACSRQTLREAEEFQGTSFGERGTVIYNGIALADFAHAEAYAHPRPYILAIGRHVREKGFDVLLRAFSRSGDLGFDLIIAGDGQESANLKGLSVKLNLASQVYFPGRVDHAGAVRLFKGCAFFVLPSRHEPLGIVNLEAMAAGKAIVASRVGGVPEIVEDGENGLLVPAEDIDALCHSLQRLAADGLLRLRLGQCGERRVQEFCWSKLAVKYQQVYRSVLSGIDPHNSRS